MDEWRAILYDQQFFWLSLKISCLTQFWKFLSEFWHVISNYTYQQVINSNMGSNMAPIMVSRGGGPLRPPVGATESDMPWEVGLTLVGLSNGVIIYIGRFRYTSWTLGLSIAG